MTLTQPGLLVWLAVVCLGYGMCVGQRLEERRRGDRSLTDGDGLLLSMFLGSLAFAADQAGRLGMLGRGATLHTAVGIGYVVAAALSLLFIFRLLRQVEQNRRGAA